MIYETMMTSYSYPVPRSKQLKSLHARCVSLKEETQHHVGECSKVFNLLHTCQSERDVLRRSVEESRACAVVLPVGLDVEKGRQQLQKLKV